MPALPTSDGQAAPPSIEIETQGELAIRVHGIPLRFLGRGPRRPLALLGALVAAGEHGSSSEALADLLWPEADGFDAYRALITTVHRLRRLLSVPCAVGFSAGRLKLATEVCCVDLWGFERVLQAATTPEQLAVAVALYRGPFLGDSGESWAVGVRARLGRALARAARRLGVRLDAEAQLHLAAPETALGEGSRLLDSSTLLHAAQHLAEQRAELRA
jgi:DNA-binding SARP family transcriptional activator